MPGGRGKITAKDGEKYQWKKGQSGNPKGRPVKPDIDEVIAKCLSDDKNGMNALEAIFAAMRLKATKGDVAAAQLILDRGYGKVKQDVGVSGEITQVIVTRKK